MPSYLGSTHDTRTPPAATQTEARNIRSSKLVPVSANESIHFGFARQNNVGFPRQSLAAAEQNKRENPCFIPPKIGYVRKQPLLGGVPQNGSKR